MQRYVIPQHQPPPRPNLQKFFFFFFWERALALTGSAGGGVILHLLQSVLSLIRDEQLCAQGNAVFFFSSALTSPSLVGLSNE